MSSIQNQSHNSDARERVLAVAERLFAEKGYAAVTLRDIAAEVGIRHTSLYHHVPGGKEDLFVEVMERHYLRHRQGLTRAIAQADLTIHARLHAAADWLLSQPPMDLLRMRYSDLPSIAPQHADRLSMIAYTSLIVPIEVELYAAQQRGEIQHPHIGLIAGGIIGMVESIFSVPDFPGTPSKQTISYELIDVILAGLTPRHRETKE